MENVIVGGDQYEISCSNGNWRTCDLNNGFLVLINQDVGVERIEKVLEESSFTPFNYNTPFKSKGNRSICLRFNLDKSRESELIDMLELFN
tara:strand:- start:8 stop:280 length:273 start_codon:yes stop_codon:yes gene_type:complete